MLAWEALSVGVEPEIRGFVVSLPLSFKVGQKRVAEAALNFLPDYFSNGVCL